MVYAIRENDQKLFNFLAERPGIDLGIVDNNGKSLGHHVVNPRVVGSYENVEMLNELHKLGVDFKVKDRNGSTPYDYASQQDSGVMAARLEELKADNRQLFDLKRAPTNILGDVNFPPVVHDFETDYEVFNTNCEEEAKKRRINITREPAIESKISGTVELCWEDADKQNAWDCLMVKCEVSRGYWSCNVFYKMQVVKDKVRGVFVLFTRWGRVNTEGQWQQTPFGTYEEATKEFSKIFKSKSANDWATRANFEKVPGKYRLIQWTKKLKHTNQVKNFDLDQCKVSVLSKTALRFLYRVTSPSGFLSAYANFRVDESLFPLQNLTKETLIDAENILKNIQALIAEKDKMFAKKDKDLKAIAEKIDELSGLSSQFFELVPFRDDQGTTIDPIMNEGTLTNYRKVIFDLVHFEIVIKLMCASYSQQYKIGPYDYIFNCMSFKMASLSRQTEEFGIIQQYIINGLDSSLSKSMAQNNYNFGYGNNKPEQYLTNIYAVERKGEKDKFKAWSGEKNSMLLWHGTKTGNVMGILQNGFRIAPTNVDSSGAMFGEGIYFADRFHKAYQYSEDWPMGRMNSPQGQQKDDYRYMFLCEVILGKCKQVYEAKDYSVAPNINSTQGVGLLGPDPKKNVFLGSGCTVPMGEVIENNIPKVQVDKLKTAWGHWSGLRYNEYCVYDRAQVLIRYIVEIKNVQG